MIDQPPNATDLAQSRMEKMLMSETRVDRHDEHLVQVGQNFFEHVGGSRRIDRYAGAFSKGLDILHGSVQVEVAFPVDQERVRAGVHEFLKKEIRIRDHEV